VSDSDLPDPILVTKSSQLYDLADTLSSEPLVAVDTESNSLYAYQEQVCLIQFSIPGGDFLLDPLALQDLSPLAPIFAEPGHEKIFHAAEYDLMCLQRDFGFDFANIFDTMVAARILGWKRVGLGSILKSKFSVELNKKHQRANWGRRPLPEHLLNYARLDTHYLIPLRNRIYDHLQDANFWPLALEDFSRSCNVNGHTPASRETMCWRINGARDLSSQQAAVLQELCLYRDEIAKSLDRPVFKILNDRALIALARECPRSFTQLYSIPGVTYRQARNHARGILAAVQRGLDSPPLVYPRSPRPDEEYLNRVDELLTWRKLKARSMGVESDVVLPRDVLHQIARKNPDNRNALAGVMLEVPWRLDRFGGDILQVLREADNY